MKRRPHNAPRAFMLPVCTLAVVSLLLLLVGLLTVSQVEKQTADAYSDARQLQLALDSASAAALDRLHTLIQDDSLVFRAPDPINEDELTIVSNFDRESRRWRSSPLASGAMDAWSSTAERPFIHEILAELEQSEFQREALALGADEPPVRAQWLPSAVMSNGRQIRIAWWCEDLDARLDGRLAGTEIRKIDSRAAEDGLFSLFRPTDQSPSLHIDSPEHLLSDFKNHLKTEDNLGLVLESSDAAIASSHLSYSLPPRHDPPPRTLIPHGFNYPDAGKPTMDLNRAVDEKNVQGIADHIAKNLPRFHERRGGLPADEDYLKTLAASIIDYADQDSLPTTGTGYRGIDSYPFVNQIFDRYRPIAPTKARTLAVEVRTFVELWNPTQLEISGSLMLHHLNRVGFVAGEVRRFSPVKLRPRDPVVVLKPNEYRVLEFLNHNEPMVYEFPSSFSYGLPYRMRIAYDNGYELFWNDVLVDAPKRASPGMTRGSNTAWMREDPKEAYFSGNLLPVFPAQGSVGDPRATWHIQRAFSVANYETNSRWGGRNRLESTDVEVRFDAGSNHEFAESAWRDGGANSSLGIAPGSRRKIPTTDGMFDPLSGTLTPYPDLQPNLAPTRISNHGKFVSLAELAHIFDPAQWLDVSAADSPPSGAGGGGFTLSIGRSEFQRFDEQGMRASQLLDLFSVVPIHDQGEAGSDVSRVNINTASRDVLRCLVAGVQLSADPAQAVNLFPPRNTQTGDLFAEAVIHARRDGPLRSLSDLATVTCPKESLSHLASAPISSQPFFGNAELYSATDVLPTSGWSDAGREELLRHVLPFVAFNSRRFRIVFAAEVLRKDGSVRSRGSREIQVEVDFHRDADGSITHPKKPRFRKLYEKAR